MLGVDDALAEVIEVLGDRQVGQDRRQRRPHALAEPADDPDPNPSSVVVGVELPTPFGQ